MIIKQISVFLENKSGRINDVAKALAANNINMQAFSMAETTDFGILRLIVSDVDKAVEVLRNANFAVILTDVVCISCRELYRKFSRAWLRKIFLSNTCMLSPKAKRQTR